MLDFLSSDEIGARASRRDLILKTLYLLTLASGLRSSQLHALTHQPAWTVFAEDQSKGSLALNPQFLAKNERETHQLEHIVFQAWLVDGTLHTHTVLSIHYTNTLQQLRRPLEIGFLCDGYSECMF